MVISQKVGGVWTWFLYQIKVESVLRTVISKAHFTQNVTCSVFCGSASHIWLNLILRIEKQSIVRSGIEMNFMSKQNFLEVYCDNDFFKHVFKMCNRMTCTYTFDLNKILYQSNFNWKLTKPYQFLITYWNIDNCKYQIYLQRDLLQY